MADTTYDNKAVDTAASKAVGRIKETVLKRRKAKKSNMYGGQGGKKKC
ncbi:hypothetical protein M0R04_06695 [Candidatus Dojkabacteria bacterium]|jgi:hypothetical protein|nr:hypothetical protein [Candidatus Dojkabacteria bacterium]